MNDKTESKTEGQGKAVVLPNGERRIDFIRNKYYTDGKHTDGEDSSRSEIKNEINDMLKEAGLEDQQIPYQIVFAATKTEEDPRVAAAERAKKKAEEKQKKEAEKAAEKDAAEAKK